MKDTERERLRERERERESIYIYNIEREYIDKRTDGRTAGRSVTVSVIIFDKVLERLFFVQYRSRTHCIANPHGRCPTVPARRKSFKIPKIVTEQETEAQRQKRQQKNGESEVGRSRTQGL